MNLRILCCLTIAILPVSSPSVVAERSLPDVDRAVSRVSPDGNMQRIDAEGPVHFRFDIRSDSPGAQISIVFDRPLSLAGKDRLVLEGRGEESTDLAVHVSRLALVAADGRSVAVYEEDFMFPPEWNRRTLLLDDFESQPPKAVRGVVLSLWEPGEAGKLYTLRLRRCEFLSPDEVAAELRPNAENVRRVIVPRASTMEAEGRRWTNLGPGGGGWFRTVAISPHDGVCLAGGDVGGVYRSSDQCRT